MYTNWPNSNPGKGCVKTTFGSGFNNIRFMGNNNMFLCFAESYLPNALEDTVQGNVLVVLTRRNRR